RDRRGPTSHGGKTPGPSGEYSTRAVPSAHPEGFPIAISGGGPPPHAGCPRTVIDPKLPREAPDRVRASQRRRGASVELVDALVAADERRRQSIAEYEQLRSEQKTLSRQIPKAQGADKDALLAKTKDLAARVKAAEASRD